VRQGAFALQWEAHGLRYGVRREIEEHLHRKRIVAINVSRTIVPEAIHRYPHTLIAEIHAAAEIRATRVAARARETLAENVARAERHLPTLPATPFTYCIENNGSLEEAGEAFCRLLTHAESA